MRRILLYIAIIHLVSLFASCEKEIMSYNGREGVYFSVRHGGQYLENLWPYQPYSNVDFVRLAKDEVEFPVKVMITGPVKDYDRVFHLEVNPDSTTVVLNEHYEAVQRDWIIPAGAISTMVKVRLKRTSDLVESPKTMGLRLVASKDFALSFPEWDAIPSFDAGIVVEEFDASLHTLRINDVMIQPAVWSGSIQAGNRESGLLGVFTRRKMEFLMEMGLEYGDFADADNMPMARLMLVATDGSALLVKRRDEGNPMLEEDGRLMWMGTVPWTSYIGVPYVSVP